ncbi:MAG: hypothetical protein U1F66_03835 [bacterium]
MTVRNASHLIQTEIGPRLIAVAYSDGSWVGNLDPDLEQAQGALEQADVYIPAKSETQGFQEGVLRPEAEPNSFSEYTPAEANLCSPDTNSFLKRSAQLWAPLRETPAGPLELRNMDALYRLGKQETGRILEHFQECLSQPRRLRPLPKEGNGRQGFLYQPYSKSPEAKYLGWIEIEPGTSPLRLKQLVLEYQSGNRIILKDLNQLETIPGVENPATFREALRQLWKKG